MDRLSQAAPATANLLVVAERGGNLGAHTIALLELLDAYGASALDGAVTEALTRDVPYLHAVRQVLDREGRAAGARPPVPIALPDDPRGRDLVVTPHAFAAYDALVRTEDRHDRSAATGAGAGPARAGGALGRARGAALGRRAARGGERRAAAPEPRASPPNQQDRPVQAHDGLRLVWPKAIDREAVDELFLLEFVPHQVANVVMVGPNRVGKSMLAKNLATARSWRERR